MNNQGKRNKQYEDSAKFTWYGFLGALLISILLTLCGCTTTKKCCDKEHTITNQNQSYEFKGSNKTTT
jgi:hypothetical protein